MNIVPDSEYTGLMGLLPARLRGFAVLARFDRPIGWWLLFWPCVYGLALAGGAIERWDLVLWMLLGAIAMRGAGCVYNDIVDRDLDARVARTASRLGAGCRRCARSVLSCCCSFVGRRNWSRFAVWHWSQPIRS
jgi:UbiA prenyltransferase family